MVGCPAATGLVLLRCLAAKKSIGKFSGKAQASFGLAARLRKLEHDALAPRAALDALSREASRGAPAARAPALPAEDRARLEAALEAQHAGLAKLLDVARVDARDVGIMTKLREKSAAPRP